MLNNYIIIAFRTSLKQVLYSAINVTGLAIGMASCLMIILYLSSELSYDRFNAKADRTYRVSVHGEHGGQEFGGAKSPAPLTEALLRELPEVEAATRIGIFKDNVIRAADEQYTDTKVLFADSSFFDVFSYELAEGDVNSALAEPRTVVLQQEVAHKFFGKGQAVGQPLFINDELYEVRGVIKPAPYNSHFRFDLLVSMSSNQRSTSNSWTNLNFYTYITTKEGVAPRAVEAKFPHLIRKYVGPQLQSFLGISLESFRNAGGQFEFYLQPLTRIHLYSNVREELEPNGSIVYVYLFAAIAVFIMLIACVNFANLSTTRLMSRAKEVGLRKVMGSSKRSIIIQFLVESLVFSTMAMILAMVLFAALLVPFENLSGKPLHFSLLTHWWLFICCFGLVVVVGIVAGAYPAFYLTAYSAVDVLRGKFKQVNKGSFTRNSLVVFQFCISIILTVFTIVVYRQLEYTRNKNLGFEKNNVLVVHNLGALGSKGESFRQAIYEHPSVVSASISNRMPAQQFSSTVFRNAETTGKDYTFSFFNADHHFINTLNLKLVQGRNFSRNFPSDSTAILINEAAARELGFKNPLHKTLSYDGGSVQIIGVVRDFNFESLHSRVRPCVIFLARKGSYASVLLRQGKVVASVSALESKWQEFVPEVPFKYSFLDDDFDALFRAEQRLGKVIAIFTGLAVFIACLGLFGLAAYTAEQRTKEIGVRKVMGASVLNIVVLLSREFTKLVMVAFLIAVPVSYLAASKWLENFAYKIGVEADIFLLAGASALVIAWLTVSYQSIKAAVANPINSIRNE